MKKMNDYKLKKKINYQNLSIIESLKLESLSIEPSEAEKTDESGSGYQKMFEVSDELLNTYFDMAWRLIEDGNWRDASDAFLFLTFLNPKVADFWKGLGMAEQSQGKFAEATTAYLVAEALNDKDPYISAYIFQCCLGLEEKESAFESYQKALEKCGEDENYTELKDELIPYEEILEINK